MNVLTYNNGLLYQVSREDGSTGTVSDGFGAPSDALPVIDGDLMFFGYQKGGLGAINLKTGALEFNDNLDGKLILTAFTACSGKAPPDYEKFQFLYFGTSDEVVKYDVIGREIVWTKNTKSIPSLGAPVVDNWQQVLVR